MAKKKKTYTPMPEIPAELAERMRTILEVQAGALTVSDAARRLGMDRNHFQTLMHRALAGMVDGLTPGKPGRPGKPEREAELEAENARLQRRVHTLEEQSAIIERLLGATGELLKARREPKAKRKKPTSETNDESEIHPITVAEMCENIPISLVAKALAVSESTIRRRLRRGNPQRVSRQRAPTREENAELAHRVRATRGQIGAASLAKVVRVSRRVAAAIKHETCTAMERERIERCARVTITTVGAVRGFDQMYISTDHGRAFLFPMADGAVPFRTSCAIARRYDERAVMAAIAADFERNGAPLVLRFDRASQHRTPHVRALLAYFGVLPLHGPAHHPRFYGQLERQNREHRAYFGDAEMVPIRDVERRRDVMLDALNALWPRRALAWKTPQDVWTTRTELRDNRELLRHDVEENARRWRREGFTNDTATRFAIERALTHLKVERGSAC